MSVDSKIKMSEEVENKDRTFGSSKSYFPVYVVKEDGSEVPALFTLDQINNAIERAGRNPEDVSSATVVSGEVAPVKTGNFFSNLFS